MGLKILVTGSRHWDPTNREHYNIIGKVICDICEEKGYTTVEDYNIPGNVTIIHGGAKGADLIADTWAVCNWCGIKEYKADWKKYGNAAGPIRNRAMYDKEQPDIVLAFPLPGSKGTWDMVNYAKARGCEVRVYNDKGEQI